MLRCGGRLRRLPCSALPCGAPQNSLRALRALRSNNCGGSVDEARCARHRRTCALRRHRGAPRPARTRLCSTTCGVRRGGSSSHATPGVARQAAASGGAVCGGEKRRHGVGARSALRLHARRSCSSAAPAGRVASSAARPQAEHRSGVGAADRHSQRHRRLPPAAPRGTLNKDVRFKPEPALNRQLHRPHTCLPAPGFAARSWNACLSMTE